MKKFISLLIVAATLFAAISSCGKYEDGPAFSLRTKKARLKGSWKIEEVNTDFDASQSTPEEDNTSILGDDLESIYKDLKIKFEKNGSGKIEIPIPGFPVSLSVGTEWEFSNSKEVIKIKLNINQDLLNMVPDENKIAVEILANSWWSFDILRLTNKEFWVKTNIENEGESYFLKLKLKKE